MLFSRRSCMITRISYSHDGSHPTSGATYRMWFRLPVSNPNLNPNPKTDPDPNPNPKSNNNLCSAKRHPNNVKFIFREYSRQSTAITHYFPLIFTYTKTYIRYFPWMEICFYVCAYLYALTYLPTQTPLLFSGFRLDRQWFLRFICAQRKNDRFYARIYMPHPSATAGTTDHTLPL